MGVSPIWDWMVVPHHLGLDGGTLPNLGLDGLPPVQDWMGVPTPPPHPGLDGTWTGCAVGPTGRLSG